MLLDCNAGQLDHELSPVRVRQIDQVTLPELILPEEGNLSADRFFAIRRVRGYFPNAQVRIELVAEFVSLGQVPLRVRTDDGYIVEPQVGWIYYLGVINVEVLRPEALGQPNEMERAPEAQQQERLPIFRHATGQFRRPRDRVASEETSLIWHCDFVDVQSGRISSNHTESRSCAKAHQLLGVVRERPIRSGSMVAEALVT